MIQVLALQIELAAVFLAHAFRIIEWAGTTHIVAQQAVILLQKLLTVNNLLILLAQSLKRPIENLRHVSPTEFSVKAFFVNVIAHIHYYIYSLTLYTEKRPVAIDEPLSYVFDNIQRLRASRLN